MVSYNMDFAHAFRKPILFLGVLFILTRTAFCDISLKLFSYDYNDEQEDAVNERIGDFLFGAKAARIHLDGL